MFPCLLNTLDTLASRTNPDPGSERAPTGKYVGGSICFVQLLPIALDQATLKPQTTCVEGFCVEEREYHCPYQELRSSSQDAMSTQYHLDTEL